MNRKARASIAGDTILEKGTRHRGSADIIQAILEQQADPEPSTAGLHVTSDHDTQGRRQSSIRPSIPNENAADALSEVHQEERKRSSVVEDVMALFSRRTSVRRQSEVRKAAKRHSETVEITTSDFDVTFGRPMELRGVYFDLQWWWMMVASGRHRSMAIFLAFLIVLLITHFVMAILMFTANVTPEDPYLCETEACEILAERILSKLNTSLDPCDNFYKFVCGDFHEPLNSNPDIDEDTFTLSDDAIMFSFKESKALGKMLRTKHKFPYSLLLPFYKGCMDKRHRDKAGLRSYMQLLVKYNLVELDPIKNRNSIEAILADLYRDNILERNLFNFDLDLNLKEYRIQRPRYSAVMMAFKSGISMYKEDMKNMLNHVNPKTGLENTSDQMLEMLICFELILYHDVSETPWEVGVESLGNCSFGAIPSGNPKINFQVLYFLEYLFVDRVPDISSWKAADDSKRHADSINFERTLRILLGQVDFEFLVRFLRWLALRNYAGELDTITASKDCSVDKYSGKCRPTASCFWSIFKVMPFLASVSFIEALDKMPHFISDVDLLLQTILNSTIEVVRMSRTERNKFLGTFSRIVEDVFRRVKVVYPIRLTEKYSASNMIDLDSIFKGLTMSKDHLTNIVAIRRIEGRTRINAHLMIKTNFSWTLRPKYQIERFSKNLMHNLLTVPVGSLEPPFFQSTFPALDVSANGFVVVQALSRMVFQDYFLRLQYSKTREKSFIGSGMSYSQFLNKVLVPYQKLLEEFSKALQTELRPHLWNLDNERFMPNEAVPYSLYVNQLADQFALKVAFTTHEKFMKQNTRFTKQRLRGLQKYSPQQIFFLSLASFRCQMYSATQLIQMKKFGPIPNPISLNLLAANSREFSETFRCPLGSRNMNPEKKINLYDD